MNTNDDITNDLLIDDEIARYLKGNMSTEEESSFLKRLQSDEEIKSKTIAMARLVKGLKEVGDAQDAETKTAFMAASERDVLSAVESVTQTRKNNVFSMKKAPAWISIAASFALVIWSGIGFYDRQ